MKQEPSRTEQLESSLSNSTIWRGGKKTAKWHRLAIYCIRPLHMSPRHGLKAGPALWRCKRHGCTERQGKGGAESLIPTQPGYRHHHLFLLARVWCGCLWLELAAGILCANWVTSSQNPTTTTEVPTPCSTRKRGLRCKLVGMATETTENEKEYQEIYYHKKMIFNPSIRHRISF